MKNSLIYTIILFLLIPFAMATTEEQIQQKALEITNYDVNITEKINYIDNYLYEITIYKVDTKTYDLDKYWLTRVGDCTEIALTKQIMYKTIGVKSRIVSGYILKDKKFIKHDYVEYTFNGRHWLSFEEKLGYDTWRTAKGVW